MATTIKKSITQEDLLTIWFDTKPSARSPYVINGNPVMWETLKDDDLTLFTCPGKTMDRRDQFDQYKEVDGLHYQWQRDGKWVGQGCQATFAYFEANGPGKFDIPAKAVTPAKSPVKRKLKS